MAIEDFYEGCVFLRWDLVPDGLGGMEGGYTDSAPFSAAINQATSTEAEIAYRSGVKTIYRVITSRAEIRLHANDRFRRLRDGQTYRVTSEPDKTPDVAQLALYEVTAEVVS